MTRREGGVSLPIGAVVLAGSLPPGMRPRPRRVAAACRERPSAAFRDRSLPGGLAPPEHLVVVGGTASAVGMLKLDLSRFDADALEGLELSLPRGDDRIIDRLEALPSAARATVPGLDPGRAEIIIPGPLHPGSLPAIRGMRPLQGLGPGDPLRDHPGFPEAAAEAHDGHAHQPLSRPVRLRQPPSRRGDLIRSGEVEVDGKAVTDLSLQVEEGQKVTRAPASLARPPEEHVYGVLNKPKGYLCSATDPFDRPTIYDLLRSEHSRLHYVGRLDFQSRGLLILTTDGELTQQPAASQP